MLSSCPDCTRSESRRLVQLTALLAAPAVFGALPARAAQVYLQPVVSMYEEYDSNLDLDPTGHNVANIGYFGDAATLIGIASPDSNTSIRPRLRYEEFPNESTLNRLEAMLDFNSNYSTTRSRFNIYGRFDHLNDQEAEVPSAVYNDITPVAPTVTQTGAVNFNVTRNNLWTSPSYTWRLTPILNIGVSGVYQSESFSPADAFAHVSFNYYQGALSFGGDLGPRTDFQLQGYSARYQAKNIISTANSDGGSAALHYNWSAVTTLGISAQYQHSDINASQPQKLDTGANTWGAALTAQWRLPTGQFRLNAGRLVTPSSGGSLYVAEQAQAQYDKELTERLTFTGALMYIRSHSLAGVAAGYSSSYRRADLSLKWMLTRTWFMEGGYGYLWDKYLPQLGGALDNLAYLRFGYQGLPRQ